MMNQYADVAVDQSSIELNIISTCCIIFTINVILYSQRKWS